MRKSLTIAGKDLRSFFVSPVAYVVIMIFLLITGYFFFGNIKNFQDLYKRYQTIAQIYKQPEILERINLNSIVIEGLLFNMVFILLFLMPAIMMRSFAEEKRNGTEELLMTSPITVTEIVAGKFLGSLGFVFAMLLPTIVYQILLFRFAEPEIGPVITGYLGVFGFACIGISIGLFASSLTQNQIIAMVITFVIMIMLFVIGMLDPGDESNLSALIKYLSFTEHARNLMRGIVDTKDLIYFASVSFTFLFLTKQSVESVRWR